MTTDDVQSISREVAKLQLAMADVQEQLRASKGDLKAFADKFEHVTMTFDLAVTELRRVVYRTETRVESLENGFVAETRKRLDKLEENLALLANANEYMRKRVCSVEDNSQRQSDWYREQFENRIVAAEDARSTLSDAVVQLRREVTRPKQEQELIDMASRPADALAQAMRQFFDDQTATRPKLSGELTPWYLPDACIAMLREKGFAVENPE